MRKLMWLTIGFAAACVVGVYITAGNWLLLMAAVCVAAAIPLFLLKQKRSKIAAVSLVGCVVGFLWLWGYHQLYLNTAKSYDGKTTTATVEISDYSYETSYGCAADGKIRLKDKTYQIRVYLTGDEGLSPGDQVTGKIRLRMTIEGSLQSPTHHQGDGIFMLGYVDEEAMITKADDVPSKFFAAELKHEILSSLEQLFPEDTLAFAKALLLGEHHDLSYKQDNAFKISGIRHVIAVSGLHVSILFSLIYTITGRQRHITVFVGIPLLVLFAAVAGFTPSVVRACVMQGLVIIALLVNKEYDPPTALSAAVLIMLLCNPLSITSVSLQLSVGCMIGILAFSKKIHDYLLRGKRKEKAKGTRFRAKLLRWVVASVSITLSAMVITIPLSAYYFGAVSLISIVTNLLTLWLISFVFYGIMAACLLGLVWLPLGKALAWLISWPIRYVLQISLALSKIPLAAVYTASPYIVIWLVFGYLMIFLFFHAKKKNRAALLIGLLLSLLVAVGASHAEPQFDDYRITVFDVGQGQCVLFQSEGECYLVDCGGDSGTVVADQVAQQLLSQGYTQIDGIILTHYDTDHANGILPLLSQIEVKTLYLPDMEDTGTIRKDLTEQYGDRIRWITEETKIKGKGFDVTLYPAKEKEDNNENCLCVLFQRGKYDILITGDRAAMGERALLEETALPKVELLIVGHHGSADSTSLALLEQIQPTTAVISVGYGNFHNHPAKQTLTRLRLFGTTIYRTDHHGTIIFRG